MSFDADDSPPRLRDQGPEFARQLLRSSQLDEPPRGLRARLEPPSARGRAMKRVAPFAAVAVGSAALGALCMLSLRVPATPTPELKAEAPPALSIGPRPTPVSSAPAVVPEPVFAPLPPCPHTVKAAGDSPLIDDFEDKNARINLVEGRGGNWRSYGPPGTRMTPAAGGAAFPIAIANGREGSHYGLHVSGGRIKNQASVSSQFAVGAYRCYDASAYVGVEFWSRGRGRISVALPMLDTLETRWGGLCTKNCYDAHHAFVDLSADWKHYEVRFNELEQTGYGTPLKFDPTRLQSLGFAVDAPDSPFDFWVDDVAFIPAPR
ncbi:MAG: hypothetical protein QM756_03370 [Polyangiaceae bacterium]